MINFSEIFLGGIQYKYGLSELKLSLMRGFKNTGWSRISSIDVGLGNLLLVKCYQALSTRIK